jgi:cyclic pyranopterin phosphate synthase
VTAPLVDASQRRVSYLRLSLTDRCNYRCTYCMPDEGVALSPRADVLTFEELERLVACFAGLGVERVRLTGGEPTVRRGVVDVTARIARVRGIREVMMTTNGHLLADLARPLREAGLSRINVSLDTLDPARFAAITRRGELERVVRGIEAAASAGFSSVKINVVALAGFNDDELGALCRFAWERGAVPRFIEWMPMSDGALYAPGRFLAAAAIRASIERQLGVRLSPAEPQAPGSGPARYWCADPGGGQLGIISALSEHFCESCNRVRVSATGRLYVCLAGEEGADLRAALRTADDAAVERELRAALAIKPAGHSFQIGGGGAAHKHMVAIGG